MIDIDFDGTGKVLCLEGRETSWLFPRPLSAIRHIRGGWLVTWELELPRGERRTFSTLQSVLPEALRHAATNGPAHTGCGIRPISLVAPPAAGGPGEQEEREQSCSLSGDPGRLP